jgi:1-acyl-sn-glycerol-3-phosphate acyltransferase
MILARSLLYYLLLMLSVGIFGLWMLVAKLFAPIHVIDRSATRWGRLNLWLQRWICGLGYRIRGLENLPDRACIVMAKHQSAWETIALRGLLPDAQSWVLKKELLRLPVFGTGLRIARAIPIDRAAGRKAVLQVVRDGIQRLSEGRCVIIFPEGTRTEPGERRKYGLGGAVLAERSGAPVIPIAHNAGVFWRRRGVRKYPGTIDVVIGRPIQPGGRKAAEIMREVEAWIENEQAKLPLAIEN